MLDNVHKFLVDLGRGALGAFGAPTVTPAHGIVPNGTHAHVAVREGFKLERLDGPLERHRFHEFADLRSLAEWLKRHSAPDEAEILVDTKGVVVALLDADAYSGGDIVRCSLPLHPRFARWMSLLGKNLSQQQFHRACVSALEDFEQLVDQDGAKVGSGGSRLAGEIQRITYKAGTTLTSELDDLGFTRVYGGTSEKSVNAKIPPTFALNVPWFLGARETDSYDLEVHIQADAGDRGVVFGLEIPALEVVRHKAVADASAYLRDILGPEWLVGSGVPKTEMKAGLFPKDPYAVVTVHSGILWDTQEAASPTPPAEPEPADPVTPPAAE